MDPQQRLLLETVYEALEAGGQRMEDLQGSNTAAFVGCSLADAVQALRSGSTNLAIAAGTNLILGPENYIAESKLRMLSPTGRSRMFDASADGYARGEGVVTVVLKRLSDAIRDGDAIECVVREAGINQDGKTNGITMPSSEAQARLIRQVYSSAGLDSRKPFDRCQYFECHGTGTPAGDPLEAQAIRNAFFGDGDAPREEEDLLYVGSIKTVLGHTEATAGLAGLLKASLALRQGVVPPNMLFERINPEVQPFYSGYLQVPTKPEPWPDQLVADGSPRRASVNSFGFGGANAHVILESWDDDRERPNGEGRPCLAPFVFAAHSVSSIKELQLRYSAFLRERRDEVDLADLAWTQYARRTQKLPVRSYIAATTISGLIEQLEAAGSEQDGPSKQARPVVSQPKSQTPKFIGIFTGQGAQWAGMGRELLQHSEYAQRRIGQLDSHLQQLPPTDRPSWLISETLLDQSDIGAASLSQPVCCAVQILLVDLITAAGISFHSVVGHSSGEIAAAYAAGYLSDVDAMTVAYYRGIHSAPKQGTGSLAGSDGPGKMMAVATSREDALHLCSLRRFRGRICVAAHNGPNSVTLSGDEDAILEAKVVFEDEEKGAKVLFVDQAYHSHHMLHCAEAYGECLSTQAATFNGSRPKSQWFSSVYVEEATRLVEDGRLNQGYWNANMIGEVKFADALRKAVSEAGPFDAAIEVGPHAALRAPSLATLSDYNLDLKDLPYTGLLKRGQNSTESVAAALGYLWAHLGGKAVDIQGYEALIRGPRANRLVTGLPRYAWDHGPNQEYWHESRVSRAFRSRKPTHELLGNMLPDGTPGRSYRWRNHLSVNEVPWLGGHRVQGQAVFPAAGYVCMAFQAARSVVDLNRPMELLEVRDVNIDSALAFPEDDVAVETLFEMVDINMDEKAGRLDARFFLSAATGAGVDALSPKANGRIVVLFGDASVDSDDVLPLRPDPEPMMKSVDDRKFYDALSKTGFGYSGPFRGLSHMRRKAGFATGQIQNLVNVSLDDPRKAMIVHPAFLDLAFQAIMLAYCYPEDGRLWAVHVPRHIRSIQISPELCAEHLTCTQQTSSHIQPLYFDAVETSASFDGVVGDVGVYAPDGQSCMVQVDGLHFVPLAEASPENDTRVFSKTVWAPSEPDIPAVCYDGLASAKDHELALDLERACVCYLRQWATEFTSSHPIRVDGTSPLRGLLRYADHVLSQVASGNHKHASQEWMSDDPLVVLPALLDKHGDECLDLKMVNTVGQQIPAVLRGETTMLEHLLHDDLLSRYYRESLGMRDYTGYLARGVKQLTHRFPNMTILEVGGGTGHATKSILAECEGKFDSYTFTDVSPGFFPTAEETFGRDYADQGGDRMQFRVLDMEKDIATQGFAQGHYDLIVASFVLHITEDLESTLRNVRRLLKPGGFLILAELTDNDVIRSGFIFGSLPGWWIGGNDGRVLSPCIAPSEWDTVLRKTGFSGADSVSDDRDTLPRPASIIVSQAVDWRIRLLRDPATVVQSTSEVSSPLNKELIIIGGQSTTSMELVKALKTNLTPLYGRVRDEISLDKVAATDITQNTSVLNLFDLDTPVFENLTQEKLSGLKRVVENAKTIVWVTSGRRNKKPYANMSVGFGRSLFWEIPDLRLQFVDFEDGVGSEAQEDMITAEMLRFEMSAEWKASGALDRDKTLWSVELEVLYAKTKTSNCTGFIPRLVVDREANRRYNAAKRKIEEPTDLSNVCVEAIPEPGSTDEDLPSLDLQRGPLVDEMRAEQRKQSSDRASDTVLLHVEYSSPFSVPVASGSRLYVLAGTMEGTGALAFALAETTASSVLLPHHQVKQVDAKLTRRDILTMMLLIVDGFMAANTLKNLVEGDELLVHEPSSSVALIIKRLFRTLAPGVVVHITTTTDHSTPVTMDSDHGNHDDFHWIRLPQRPHPRTISRMLPKPHSIAKFVNFATSNGDSSGMDRTSTIIEKHVANTCIKCSVNTFFTNESGIAQHDSPFLRQHLVARVNLAQRMLTDSSVPLGERNPVLLPVSSLRTGQTSVLDFQNSSDLIVTWDSDLPVVVRPADHSSSLFRGDRSYWLVGLTGDLGLSLTLPALAGVAQAAMVLRDSLIKDMDMSKMQSVLDPKVQGSLNLCRVLEGQDSGQQTKLDFMIFFSSMAGLVGNLGQSNYSAANAFLISLAAQRREQGLAASVINIGVIVGIGYITREVSDATLEDVREGGYMFLPEQAFHAMFAEAVTASNVNSGRDPEISTGVAHVQMDGESRPIWIDNPRFSHHVLPAARDYNTTSDKPAGNSASIETQLAEAKSKEDLFNIVKDAFSIRLQHLLKMDPDIECPVNMPLMDFGIDSLIAVEIRKWFLKNLSVNVPVLKILGGATVADVVNHAISQLSATQTPLLCNPRDDENQKEPKTDTPKTIDKEVIDYEKSAVELSDSVTEVDNGLFPDGTTLNHTTSLRITGQVDSAALSMAFAKLAHAHEILRTSFYMDSTTGHAVQAVMDSPTVQLEVKHLGRAGRDYEKEVSRVFREVQSNWVHALDRGQALRAVLLTSDDPGLSFLVVGCHHIIVDGSSQEVMMRDLAEAYSGQTIIPRRPQYLDFTRHQMEDLSSGSRDTELQYWRKVFHNVPEPLPLLPLPGSASTRTKMGSNYNFHRATITLSHELTLRINEQSRVLKSTPFHFYLAVFRALLVRLTQGEDLCIGIASASRSQESADGIGPYVNLVPVRLSRKSDSDMFPGLLEDTRNTVLEALDHSGIPFAAILNDLKLPRNEYYTPLFQALVDYREGVVQGPVPFGESGLTMEVMDFETGMTGYDLNIDIANYKGGCKIDVMVQSSLYSEGDPELLLEAYQMLLDAFSANAERDLFDPPMFAAEDVEAALDIGKATLVHRVAQIASQNGSDIAIQDGHGCSITYQQMLDRVMDIACELLGMDLDDGTVIAVFQDRTTDCICSILAIMYTGVIYVPVDADPDSAARSAAIVKDCRPKVLLADDTTMDSANALELAEETVAVNVSKAKPHHILPGETPAIKAAGPAPAVILYTSGTTGTPKGVSIAHKSLVNEIEFSAETYGVRREKVLQQSSLSFDMSLTQIFSALAFGGTLYVVPAFMRADAASVAKVINQECITMTGATPSEYLSWIAHGAVELQRSTGWRTAICGGEQMTESLVSGFTSLGKAPGEPKLFNAFGPTEATCSSNRREVDYANPGRLAFPLSVGWTAPNARIYIMEPQLETAKPSNHPFPVSWTGEIVIGGAGVALGYHNDASSPKFAPDLLDRSQKMHKTGDIGKLLPDGQLMVLGRTHGDTRIKLSGVRMSPYEIESAILQSGNGRITEAVVTKRRFNELRSWDIPSVEALVAHIVLHPDIGLNPTGAHVALGDIEGTDPLRLPRAMRPSLILPVPSLPKSSTGKIDRNAVSKLPLPQSSPHCQQPSPDDRDSSLTHMSEGVRIMAGMWSQVVPADVLSRHALTEGSDFFSVGGSSLLLVELRELIVKETGVRLRLDHMFGASTLQGMAELVQDTRLEVDTPTQTMVGDKIDWDYETTPPLPDTQNHTCDLPSDAPEFDEVQHPKVIILTGATGQLGRALLTRLSDCQSVSEVHCLAVRGASRLPNSPKVHTHPGDLREPNLGMHPADAARVFASADTIIHNGAEVNFLRPYRSLRSTNVESTREILRLALHSRRRGKSIAFHYISSAAVSLCAECDSFGEVSVRKYTPDALDGYSQTKWASEVMLERATEVAENLGLTIHRPSHIMGENDSDESPLHNGSPDLLDGLLDHCRFIGAVPKLDKVRGTINLVARNDCASSIFGHINTPVGEMSTRGLKFLHHIGGQNILLGDINGHLAQTGGDTVEEIPLGEWMERAKEAGLRKDFAAYLQDLEQGSHTYHYPILQKESCDGR
ncbi:hypothetical protein INS49_004775 [Diaporthe citri]|uniref:uncharacterized protein n=1 Tax=Diaporthe citri TaxID=83186 RepID=UPI001C7F9971|nr:uncharacterized protein INS49_004775 [Diaporthe citri]KAG6354171.1 hypothetical protein INS49_004775 [Diaporthe citri]